MITTGVASTVDLCAICLILAVSSQILDQKASVQSDCCCTSIFEPMEFLSVHSSCGNVPRTALQSEVVRIQDSPVRPPARRRLIQVAESFTSHQASSSSWMQEVGCMS